MTIPDVVERADVADLADSVRRTGFGVVKGVVQPEELRVLHDHARNSVARKGNESTYLTARALVGTAIGELARAPQMRALLAGLYEECVQAPPAAEEVVHPALRCLYGRSGAASSLRFHFDSYAVTALLPIEIPTVGNRGDLLYYPNLRGVRSSALRNVVDKAVCQNPLSARLIASRTARSVFTPQRRELTPGDLYLFCGYRTLHGNDRCDLDRLRATALFHFGNPHLHDPLVRLVQRRATRAGL